ncbi:hypothetical protein F5Y19DRAFT_471245 [Xylariaceae sp. FL1651]|nr:hypothetical protein F5Y19DRAFT_471245 [Xylariaceae sp. FL1651]
MASSSLSDVARLLILSRTFTQRACNIYNKVPTSFPRFLELPVELQIEIWKLSFVNSRIHVLRPPDDHKIMAWWQSYACPVYQVFDAETNDPINLKEQPALACKVAYDTFRRGLERADLSCFDAMQAPIETPCTTSDVIDFKQLLEESLEEGDLPALSDWDSLNFWYKQEDAGNVAVLRLAHEFRMAEAQMARQSFFIAQDRDLVYLTDVRNEMVFLKMWASTWFNRTERLALLICDCALTTRWQDDTFAELVEDVLPEQVRERAALSQTRLKEIMLVVRPKPSHCDGSQAQPFRAHLAGYQRDRYGFVAYDNIYYDPIVFQAADRTRVDQAFREISDALPEILSEDLRQSIKISWVVDIDCKFPNVDSTDGTYMRFPRY